MRARIATTALLSLSVLLMAAPARADEHAPPGLTPASSVPLATHPAARENERTGPRGAQKAAGGIAVLVAIGLPVLGAAAGQAAYERDLRDCGRAGDEDGTCGNSPLGPLPAMIGGAAIGAVGALVIDVVLLATVAATQTPRAHGRGHAITPRVDLGERGVSLGVLGRF